MIVRRFKRLQRRPFDFLNHHQTLDVVHVDRKRGAGLRLERGVAGRHADLDVLRVVIAAANDDQILQAAGHKERSVVNETEIARPQ